MAQNLKQQAAAELTIGIGHLQAALHLWSPSTGLSPAEARASSEVQAWERLDDMVNAIAKFACGEGPGA